MIISQNYFCFYFTPPAGACFSSVSEISQHVWSLFLFYCVDHFMVYCEAGISNEMCQHLLDEFSQQLLHLMYVVEDHEVVVGSGMSGRDLDLGCTSMVP